MIVHPLKYFVNNQHSIYLRSSQPERAQHQLQQNFAKRFCTTISNITNTNYNQQEDEIQNSKIIEKINSDNKYLLQSGPSKSIVLSHISTENYKSIHKKKKYSVYTLAYEQTKHLYNCGENALRHLVNLKYPISHMTHIFISKLTASALCGLPQLVLNISLSRSPDIPPLQVIGPAGIKNWVLHSSLISSSSFGTVEFRELQFRDSYISSNAKLDNKFEFSLQNILPNNDGIWEW
jgi:hypothetical protein